MLTNEKRVYPPVEVEIPFKSWQKLLLDAANIIEKRGWALGEFETQHHGVCLLGALHLADNGNPSYQFKPRGFTYWWAKRKLDRHLRKVEHCKFLFRGLNCMKWN